MTSATLTNEEVNLILKKSEALVLFEWLSRNWEKSQWQNKEMFSDPAEKQLLMWMESDLQKVLVEPFDPNYKKIVLHSYREIVPEPKLGTIMSPNLNDWVWVQVMINQAMLGVISGNVRQISLTYENGWKISAILEHLCEQDSEDIQDIAEEASIFIEDIKNIISPCAYSPISVSISSSVAQLENLSSPECRMIFRRKEITTVS